MQAGRNALVHEPITQAGQDGRILIEARGLGVRRGARWLVRGIDLTLRAKEIVSLIGPNGSGKSTTVKTVLGILNPDEGTVSRAAEIRVGYVPQGLSIANTLPMPVWRLMSLTGRYGKTETAAALAEVGIEHLIDAPVQTLSGGEFQRALLARAIIAKPDVLVLDEPVQGVDFAGEIAMYELIAELRDVHGCGILLISHDLHIVMGRTDTVVCLNGHVCCSGPPQSVAASPEYQELFGAKGAEALAVYTHHHDHAHLPDGRVVPLDAKAGDEEGPHHHA
ncbi:MAG: metal ABC transporter ATP-binding protein [Rhodospirillaceae bacterium]|nr:metal ABC transporter ATP-binding protein [Rhodospirillaceae bacterium]